MSSNKLERIHLAAKELFSKKGFAETSMSEIAEAAALSVGTIYNYFPSKDELFNSLGIPEKKSYRPEFEKKRIEIARAALRLFGENGFGRTTMEDVSQEVGLSKAALYQYFDNKEELLLSLTKESEMYYLLNELPKTNSIISANKSIDEIGYQFLAMYNQPERINLLRTIISESKHYPEIGQLVYQETIGQAYNKVAMYLEKNNLTEGRDAKFAARAFLGMFLSFVVVDKLINNSEEEFTREEIVSGVVDIFINGIGNTKHNEEE